MTFHVHVPTEEELEQLFEQHQQAVADYTQTQLALKHYDTVEEGWNIWSDAHYDALIQQRHAKAVALWLGRRLVNWTNIRTLFLKNMLS